MTRINRISKWSSYGFVALATVIVVIATACSDASVHSGIPRPSVSELNQALESGQRDYAPEELRCSELEINHELSGSRYDHLRTQSYCVTFEEGLVKFQSSRPQVEMSNPTNNLEMSADIISGPDDGRIVLVDSDYCVSSPDSKVVGLDCPLIERLSRVCTSWHGYYGIDPLWFCLGVDDADEFLDYSFVMADDPERVYIPLAGVTALDCGEVRLITQSLSDCDWVESEFILPEA